MPHTNMPKSFSVRCLRGVDQGICATDCIDEFEILGDGVPMFRITYDYGMDDNEQTMSVRNVGHLNVSDLPFFNSGFQLGGKLMEFLDQLLNEQDKEFYADCFHDEEGEPVMFSINKLIFGGE